MVVVADNPLHFQHLPVVLVVVLLEVLVLEMQELTLLEVVEEVLDQQQKVEVETVVQEL